MTDAFEGPPVTLRVRCLDALRFSNGEMAGEQEWVYFIQVPFVWAFSPGLQERVLRITLSLYQSFNWHHQVHPEMDDGSRYILENVETAVLSEDQEKQAPWRGKSLYALRPDGSIQTVHSDP